MNKRINHIVSSFTDYKGVEHKFVVVAISEVLPKVYEEFNPKDADNCSEYEKQTEVSHWVNWYTEWDSESVAEVVKSVSIGVAICNPEDTFNEETGYRKAMSRAKLALYATHSGYISTRLVQAMLEQEAYYIKSNPGKYIKGYNEAEKQFNKKKRYENLLNSLDTSELQSIKIYEDLKSKLTPEELKNITKLL